MSNILKFPQRVEVDLDIKEMVSVIWPNKLEVIKRNIEELVMAKQKWVDNNRDSGAFSHNQMADSESRIGGLLEALYVIDREGK